MKLNKLKLWASFALKLAGRLLYVWMPDWVQERVNDSKREFSAFSMSLKCQWVKGDKLVIQNDDSYHRYKLGDVVELLEFTDDIFVRATKDDISQRIRIKDLRKATFADFNPPEPVKPPAKKKRKPAVKKSKIVANTETIVLDTTQVKPVITVTAGSPPQTVNADVTVNGPGDYTITTKPKRTRRSKAQILADKEQKEA